MSILSKLSTLATLILQRDSESITPIKNTDPEILIEYLMEASRRIPGFNLTCDYADNYKLKLNVFSGHTVSVCSDAHSSF